MAKGKILKYKTPKELLSRAYEYIDKQKATKQAVLYTGLLLHLDLNKDSFNRDYSHHKDFKDAVAQIKLEVEQTHEKNLHVKGQSPVGSIFALKNFGWTDKTDISLETKEPLEVSWTGKAKKSK